MVLSIVPFSAITAFASERDREIVAVDSGNSFNMRLSDEGVLTWDEVTGANGYKVMLLNSMGQTINEWDNALTNSRVLQFIVEMDNSKYDSGRYVIEVEAKDTNKKATMSYYYTSNVDKLEAPAKLKWIGNQAAWEYVDGAVEYKLSLYDFAGLVITKTVTECPVDLSEYNPQDGWTFSVQAKTNGTLNDKRNSNIAESPKKGTGTRTVNLVDSGNALNMKVIEGGVLTWDEVIGATGYQVILKNPIGVEIYRWDTDFTNNYRMLPIITEMDDMKIDSGHYRIEVEPKGAGSVAFIANYYYTSHVEQFEEPHNLKWNESTATWTAVDGASSYVVTLYDFNGKVKTVPVTDDWYDFSAEAPQDGWTFTVQAKGDGTFNAKRSSNVAESPAKTTSYNLTVVAYGLNSLSNTGKVSLETVNGSQDFSTSVGDTFIKNTEVTVKAEANSGYEFVAWRVTAPENPEATLSTNATHTFKLENNLQLFAVFRAIPTEYSVAYHGNGASGYMPEDTVAAGGTYTLKECSFYTPDGTKFVGWAIGSPDATPLKQPGEQITVTNDTTIYAVWENLYFTTQPTDTSGKIGKDVILPVTINLSQVHNDDGYNIVLEVMNGVTWEKVDEAKHSEWNSLNGGFTVQQNSTCIKSYQYKIYNGTEWIESDTFTVEFLPLVVTFVDNTHSTITEPIELDTVGGKISKPNDPTYPGDKFDGWWADGEWDFENRTVTQDITLSASWAGCGYYGDIPNVYAKPGEKAKIDLSNVNYNNTYTYVYKYDGANWVQVENVTNYSYYNLPASAEEKTETYKIVINASKQIESNEFTVTWTNDLPTYYVSYGVGEGQGSGDVEYVEHGTSYTLDSYEDFGTIIAPNGKVFDYWSIRVGENAMDSIEIAQKKAGETITVTSNVYAIAMWKNAPTVMVSYYSVGNNIDSDMVSVGTQHTLMDAQGLEVPSGKQFKAWAIGGLGGEQKQPGDEITITKETYIYAVWEDITYTVSFNANGGAGSMLDETEQLGGYVLPECTFTAPTGKQFKCWAEGSASGTQYNVGYEYDVTANVTFYAVWEDIPAVPTGLTASYNGTILAGNKLAINQLTVKLQYSDSSEMPCAGLCEYWYNGSKIDDPINYVFGVELIGTRTITVKYQGFETTFDVQVVGYEITFNANTGSGTMESVEYVGAYTLPTCGFTAPTGKQFKGWATSANGEVIDGTTYNVTANVEFFAIWENIPVTNYTITATAGANGTISPSGDTTVAQGANQTYTITANSGYHIKDVKVNGSSVGAVATYTFTNVTANATITVEFEVDTVPHVCNPTLVPEDEPDCTTAGKSAYYHCGCGKNYEDAQGNTEIANLETWGIQGALGHDPSTAWSTDGEYHWRECTRCAGQQLEKAVHSGGTATCTEKAVCATCNTAYGNTVAHSHGSEWKTDESEHWNECTCGDKANKAAHTDSNNDGKCDTCEYQMTSGGGNTETPDNPNNTPDDPTDDKDGLGAGAIVGIVIGSVAVAGAGGFALLWFVIKKKSFADLIAVFKK